MPTITSLTEAFEHEIQLLHRCYSLTTSPVLEAWDAPRAGSAPTEKGYHEEAHLTRHDRFRARCRHHDGSHTVGCRVRYLALRLSGASRRSRLSRVKATQDANRPVGRHPIPRHPMPPGLEAEAEAHLRDPKR